MPIARFQMPDGRVARFEVPDGTTPEQAQTMMEAHFAESPPAPKREWSDVPMEAVKNIPSSAANFAKNIWEAVSNPVETAKAVGNTVLGGVQNLNRYLTEQSVKNKQSFQDGYAPSGTESAILGYKSPQMEQASVAGQALKDRYGGIEQIKNTIATDPVGVLSDISTPGGKLAKLNPVNLVADATKQISKPIVGLGKHGLGLTTGVGPESVTTAFKSGMKGDDAFYRNMTGDASMMDVLDQAKSALQNMRNDRTADYKTGIASTSADTTKLNFKPIDDALDNVIKSMKSGNHWKIGNAEVAKLDELSNIVAEWRADPSAHTAMGLDALKQRLDALYPDSPSHQQAQRAITNVRKAVKDTIVNQSPEYATTMRNYEDAISLEKEIEKALSIGNKASADTALRKLQSLSRNNAQTNYGNRLELAKALKEQGGQDLMPAVAGQAMNSWVSRGLAGQGGNLATLGTAFFNPIALSLLPLQSPKAVGATLYGAGKAGQKIKNMADKSPLTREQIATAINLLSQAGKLPPQQMPLGLLDPMNQEGFGLLD